MKTPPTTGGVSAECVVSRLAATVSERGRQPPPPALQALPQEAQLALGGPDRRRRVERAHRRSGYASPLERERLRAEFARLRAECVRLGLSFRPIGDADDPDQQEPSCGASA